MAYVEKPLARISKIYGDYPPVFWKLIVVTFIDRLGGSLLFPFFALNITQKFDVGMTQVGVLFASFSLSSFVGSMLGGALSDLLGRRGVLIFSLISTSLPRSRKHWSRGLRRKICAVDNKLFKCVYITGRGSFDF